jgi:hypothetical protein
VGDDRNSPYPDVERTDVRSSLLVGFFGERLFAACSVQPEDTCLPLSGRPFPANLFRRIPTAAPATRANQLTTAGVFTGVIARAMCAPRISRYEYQSNRIA